MQEQIKARTPKQPPAPDPLAENLWSAEDVAQKLGIPARLVGDMARRNEIPSIKVGMFRRYQPAAIRRHIARLV